jgi:cyclopropane fatty-acyl-phospholipid synthase-like methyltransferase
VRLKCGYDRPMSTFDPKQIVAAGYDRIAERYSAWTGTALRGPRARFVAALQGRLPRGAAVLELGCATGIPVTRALAERFVVTGVDLSARQIELARGNVPAARFIHADMTTLDLAPDSFDAVIAFFAISHVPREEHAGLFAKVANWLRPGGLFVATLTAGDDPGTTEEDWLGAPMFFSGYASEIEKRQVEAAGFAVLSADEITEEEDGVPVTFLWVVTQASTPD